MAGELEAAQHQQRDQVPEVQRVRRRVEPAVQRHRGRAQHRYEVGAVGVVVDEATCVEVVEDPGAGDVSHRRIVPAEGATNDAFASA